jgi:hypothetical protein
VGGNPHRLIPVNKLLAITALDCSAVQRFYFDRMRNSQKSKLSSLPDGQREQLIFWLCIERVTYPVALKRVEEKFGVTSSKTAISHFWYRECEPYLLRQHKLKNAFLEITVRVRQGETILGETDFSVGLANPTPAKIDFDVSAKSAKQPEAKCNS